LLQRCWHEGGRRQTCVGSFAPKKKRRLPKYSHTHKSVQTCADCLLIPTYEWERLHSRECYNRPPLPQTRISTRSGEERRKGGGRRKGEEGAIEPQRRRRNSGERRGAVFGRFAHTDIHTRAEISFVLSSFSVSSKYNLSRWRGFPRKRLLLPKNCHFTSTSFPSPLPPFLLLIALPPRRPPPVGGRRARLVCVGEGLQARFA
jgi:hypothetical protein